MMGLLGGFSFNPSFKAGPFWVESGMRCWPLLAAGRRQELEGGKKYESNEKSHFSISGGMCFRFSLFFHSPNGDCAAALPRI
jgi:hypothetical protein